MMSSAAEIEKRLLEYRSRKERKNYIDKVSNGVKQFIKSFAKQKHVNPEVDETTLLEKVDDTEKTEEIEDMQSSIEDDCDDNLSNDGPLFTCSYLQITFYILSFILWLTIYIIFIKLQFGCVYFIMSALIGMYINTRTGPKRKNEVSAYSVFNKNCKSIPGTLKAEQFEREIRYGAGAVH